MEMHAQIAVFVVHVVLIVAVLYEKLLEIISKFQRRMRHAWSKTVSTLVQK